MRIVRRAILVGVILPTWMFAVLRDAAEEVVHCFKTSWPLIRYQFLERWND